MTSTLQIKDLSLSKELDGKAMSAVRGGLNQSSIGSFGQGGSGNIGVFNPVVTQVDLDLSNVGNTNTVYGAKAYDPQAFSQMGWQA